MTSPTGTKEVGMNLSELADALSNLAGVGAGGLGGALITGLFTRRRNRIDAVEKLEGIATRLAENAVAGAERRVSDVERKLQALELDYAARESRRRVTAALHGKWDNDVAASLRELGVEVPPPPPLETV
ncbi:hypothetical protein [Nocardia nova]|nr:hypothetical protein [Nocardia nova]